jgi:hypothetical protein
VVAIFLCRHLGYPENRIIQEKSGWLQTLVVVFNATFNSIVIGNRNAILVSEEMHLVILYIDSDIKGSL